MITQLVPTGTQLVIPAAPDGAATHTLARYQAQPKAFGAYGYLQERHATMAHQADQEAVALFEEMLGNSQLVLAYGNDAMAALNGVVDNLMSQFNPKEVPEVDRLLTEASDQLMALKRRGFRPNPAIRESIREGRNWLDNLLAGGKSALEILFEEFKDVEGKMDSIKARLMGQEFNMLENVAWYDQIYASNEEGLRDLIYKVAVMELIQHAFLKAAGEIVVNPENPDRDAVERQRYLNEMASLLDVKIGDYKGRLYLAWATGPNVTNMRNVDAGLALKLNTLVNIAIPAWKLTVAQWMLALRTQEAAAASDIAVDTTNQLLQEYAEASGAAVGAGMAAIERDVITVETMTAIADSFIESCNAIKEGRIAGHQARMQGAQAITTNMARMTTASRDLHQAVQNLHNPSEA